MMEPEITDPTPSKIEDMSIYELSRWGALITAIDTIEENCENMKKSFNDIDLKPIAIKHYVNSLSKSIETELEKDLKFL